MKKTLFLLSAFLTVSINAQIVQQVKYKNLTRISEKIANESLEFALGNELNDIKINKAIKNFYEFGYFDDIQVFINKGSLEFVFKEKPSISNIKMTGYKTRDDDLEQLLSTMRLKKGSMYTKEKIVKSKKLLLQELEREGYINSTVEIDVEEINEDALSLTFNVNKGDEIIIKKVNYNGAKALDASLFEEVTSNKEVDAISWFFGQNSGEVVLEQVAYDGRRVNDLYFQHGYLDATVSKPFMRIDFASNSAILDYAIIEGIQYSVNDIKIFLDASILDPKPLYENLRLKKGKAFNINNLRADVKYIKTQVADLGYAYAEVKYDIRKDEEKAITDIIFNVIPGKKVYINDVIIAGNNRTLDRVIRRNVYLGPTDLYSLTDLNDSKKKLQRSGFFDKVVIKEQRVSDDKLNLIVNVVEASTGSLIIGGGYGSYDGFMFTASVNDKNIFGSGLDLGISADISSKKTNYKVSLSNPAINDSKYNGSLSVYKNKSEIDQTEYDLVSKTDGFSASIGRRLSRNTYGGFRYKYEDILEDYDYSTTTTVAVSDQNQDQDYLISSVTPFINFDNTDNYYFPTSGHKYNLSYEIAGFNGDAKFHKLASTYKYFYSLEDKFEWDVVFRYKNSYRLLEDKGLLPQGQTFYMGGPRSVRGYQSYAFGPDTNESPYKESMVNTVELSFPLIPKAKMRLAFFYDYGMIGINSINEIQRSGTGAAIEWFSPVGPIMFIFSRPLDDEPGDSTSRFEFTIGSGF